MEQRKLLAFGWLAGTLLLLGCESATKDSRVWRASDHDRADSPPAEAELGAPLKPERQLEGAPESSSSPHGGGDSLGVRVMQVWAGKCMRCHGQIGAGDGPEGIALGARNLTDAAWQATVTDAGIADAIRAGRGRMPPIPVEPEVLAGLVKLVRQMGAHPASDTAPAPVQP